MGEMEVFTKAFLFGSIAASVVCVVASNPSEYCGDTFSDAEQGSCKSISHSASGMKMVQKKEPLRSEIEMALDEEGEDVKDGGEDAKDEGEDVKDGGEDAKDEAIASGAVDFEAARINQSLTASDGRRGDQRSLISSRRDSSPKRWSWKKNKIIKKTIEFAK